MILLRGPNGERRVMEGVVFRFLPGEVVVGSVADNLRDVITPDGIMLGNVVKKVTTALGIKQCLKCKGRQRRLNEKGLKLQNKVKRWIGA